MRLFAHPILRLPPEFGGKTSYHFVHNGPEAKSFMFCFVFLLTSPSSSSSFASASSYASSSTRNKSEHGQINRKNNIPDHATNFSNQSFLDCNNTTILLFNSAHKNRQVSDEAGNNEITCSFPSEGRVWQRPRDNGPWQGTSRDGFLNWI